MKDPLNAVKTLSGTTGNNGVANVTYAISTTNAAGSYAVVSSVATT